MKYSLKKEEKKPLSLFSFSQTEKTHILIIQFCNFLFLFFHFLLNQYFSFGEKSIENRI